MLKKNHVSTKFTLILVLLSFALILFSCSKDDSNPVTPPEENYPSITIGIFSDPHYYDPTLGVSSAAFEDYLAHDRKMLAESEAILEKTIEMINAEDVEIVLVPGDLTKDGEKQNHEKVATYLAQIEATGKKVYVIPGNHDIQNPHSMSFPDGGDPVPTPSVTPEEFKTIYNDYGFSEAIAFDPNSLTYIAQPKDSIWILAIDDCNYNSKFPDLTNVAGNLTQESLVWIKTKLQEAQTQDITVFTMMHHGLVEHFPSMDVIFPDYLIYEWQTKVDELVAAGLNIIFTGHHHANDISHRAAGSSYVIDIQTGSTITYPCPIRIVSFDGNEKSLDVTTKLITSINYDLGGLDLQTYAAADLATGLPDLVVHELMALGVDEASAQQMEPLVTATLIAYYYGDEPDHQDPTVIAGINAVLAGGDPLGSQFALLLLGIWNDFTLDNNVLVDLNTGAISARTTPFM